MLGRDPTRAPSVWMRHTAPCRTKSTCWWNVQIAKMILGLSLISCTGVQIVTCTLSSDLVLSEVSYCPWRGWFHRLRKVFEAAYRRCLAILTNNVSYLRVVIRGRLDLGLSLTCSGLSLCLAIINDASNCSSTYSHGITGHRVNHSFCSVIL